MVLLTGGTGLVGAHLLIRLIENGEKVRATYRNRNAIEKTKALFAYYQKETLFDAIEWKEADVTNITQLEEAFIGIEYVYHCAGLISFQPSDEGRLRKTNIEGTANVVNFCLANNVIKLCYISSVAALGDLAEHETVVTESTEWNPEKPHSDYAISKYGAEMEIWRGQQEGLQSVIINPGIILGPGFDDQGSGLLYKRVAKGLSFYTTGVTAFIAVPDVVEIAIKLINSSIVNERYTLVAENSSYQQILNSMSDALNVKRPSIHAKGWLLEIAWRLDKFASFLFRSKRNLTKYMARSSYNSRIFSNEKIKADLKISFIDVHQYIKKIAKV
ncbi:NAD-dependent epimerase/dehydratase family protein [Flavobacterium algicola]|uniref:NAD-dependent epimerase/dehydratase family protein n=1 Tax=Flavobacterium algicola TaxID=556529 RepID=UPI001EFDEAC0|nr:NAD-dependent epimerase/dehydratase family protein [Flavobacterium algicola]MCG9792165.1 NAD-dependent epimerase/dehydratase family protein [Flavobacterium algicola]